eukprot:Plantae.Rhodophyta-Purpureofilum_apyrenoidigerum.ctg8334.p1 GENE.Plantae.Rhodophyta-Purpureofilum_apyrenoidigerum.ctg8334~~Plantae.Rhodophyta-Purpureofilum_apyrenoidigerum.ctg8334.p1  ORF type:complete len:557 (+),score=38.21 Plantae.Rhodophyta-Purpureofilum_apyrenoidigerum.ctg8334:258-1928(+)
MPYSQDRPRLVTSLNVSERVSTMSLNLCVRLHGAGSERCRGTNGLERSRLYGRKSAAFGIAVSTNWRSSRTKKCLPSSPFRTRAFPMAVSILSSDESLPTRKLDISAPPVIPEQKPNLTKHIDSKWYVPLAGSIVHALHATCVYLGPATLLSPMRQEMNLSVSEISIPLNVYRLINSIFLVPVGMLLDRIGAQRPVRISITMAVALSFLLPLCTKLWQLTLVQGLLAVTKLFGGITPLLMVTSKWFTCRKGMGTATSILLGGYSLAGFFAPLALGVIGHQLGWRLASTMLAALFGIVSIPLTFLYLREKHEPSMPDSIGLTMDSSAKKNEMQTPVNSSTNMSLPLFTAPYIAVMLIVASYSTSLHIVLDHLMIFLTEEIGFPLKRASIYLSTVNLIAFTTKIAAGLLSERFDKSNLMPIFGALCALGSTLLVYISIVGLGTPGTILPFLAFIILYSIGYAGVFNLTMTCLPDFGMDRLGTRSNLNLVVLFAFGSIGSYLAGVLRTTYGKYAVTFGLNSAACFMVLIFSLLYKHLTDKDRAKQAELKDNAGTAVNAS